MMVQSLVVYRFPQDSTITNAVVGIRSVIGANCTIQVGSRGAKGMGGEGGGPEGWPKVLVKHISNGGVG